MSNTLQTSEHYQQFIDFMQTCPAYETLLAQLSAREALSITPVSQIAEALQAETVLYETSTRNAALFFAKMVEWVGLANLITVDQEELIQWDATAVNLLKDIQVKRGLPTRTDLIDELAFENAVLSGDYSVLAASR